MLRQADPESFAPQARNYFFDADGRPRPEGYVLKNPDLAETLAVIVSEGPDAFYKGVIAADKPVFQVEYEIGLGKFCAEAEAMGLTSMRKRYSLRAWRKACWEA